jgi:RIO-like serine/threonine protein kinase
MINPRISCAKINNKNIFSINQHPDLLMKKCTIQELKNHEKACEILKDHVPKVVFSMSITDHLDSNVYMVMEKINGMSVADMYGENPLDIPINIFENIRQMLYVLKEHKIDYIDITGYNFMIDDNGKFYVIDFEHCIDRTIDNNVNDGKSWFLNEFLSGSNIWNPDFE